MEKFIGAVLLFGLPAILIFVMLTRTNQVAGGTDLVTANSSKAPVTVVDKQRGLSWVGGDEIGAAHVAMLAATGADWIVQTPFGWQQHHNSPEIQMLTGNHGFWGERDAGLIATAQLARASGIKTMLKPHIWLTRPADGRWRSHIAMDNDAAWQQWFASYSTFILHYARLARDHEMEALCIGTELYATVKTREQDWRLLIGKIREVFPGKLTYAANWHEEYEATPFWDALDFIGVQAYFPLSDGDQAGLEELKAGWRPHLARIEAVCRRYGKPVIFTEIGYRSQLGSAREPWLWPKEPVPASAEDLAFQARCYEAFFQEVWPQPWLAGAYFWKWFPLPETAGRDQPPSQGFTPQFKPAQEVLQRWYGKR